MKTTLHKANSRGLADHGWLKSYHSFSFASYHNEARMGFGLLRVLNDDQVGPGKGFETHPHRDMEIVSIPLAGALRHKDNQGNVAVIHPGEVQLMSAGTGVSHSEFNHSKDEDVQFLQIWIIPEKLGVQPRYDQRKFDVVERKNRLQMVISPVDKNGGGIKINQQAYISLADLNGNNSITYDVQQSGNGIYLFVLEGEIEIGNETLTTRDAIGTEDVKSISVVAKTDSKILFIEVPMV